MGVAVLSAKPSAAELPVRTAQALAVLPPTPRVTYKAQMPPQKRCRHLRGPSLSGPILRQQKS